MFIQNDINSSPLSTAFHEAGHVLIHEIFDWPYIDVSVTEAGKEGVNYSYPDPKPNSPDTDKLIYACVCCAGAVAEDKFKFGHDAPKENLGASLIAGYGYFRSDATKFQELRLPAGTLENILEITADIVLENWEAVSNIAQIINEQKHVCSEDIHKLLNETSFRKDTEQYLQRLIDVLKSFGG